MKIKILPALVVVLLLFATLNVIAITPEDEDNVIRAAQENHLVSFSSATFTTDEEYLLVNLQETDNVLTAAGKPMLPVYTKTFIFPRGTKIKDVICEISDVTSEVIDGKLKPSPPVMPRISLENYGEEAVIEDENIYSSSNLFPNKWYDYEIYCGIVDGEDSIIVKVNSYPVRYSPAENTLYSIDSIDIKVTYEETAIKEKTASEYDLLIITPRRFKLFLLPLYFHKTRRGVNTKIETVESIYKDFEGRDKPEQIKHFIQYAKENWGITNVLFVGGLKSHFNADDKDSINEGSTDWYVPVRYIAPHPEFGGHISDLYYADLYKWNETLEDYEFEDWDNNSNGTFGEVGEEIDLYPDVYFGRLPCRNIFEVRTIVNKIIEYERPSIFDKLWMNKMIAAGGITFEYYEGQPDGEWLCNLSLEYMSDIIDEPVRVFASNEDYPRPTPRDIIKEFSKGAGFVLLQGHGNAFIWETHWPDTDKWAGGIMTFEFRFLKNKRKLPIVVVGGCHNGIFNVTLMKTLLDTGGDEYESNYHAYGTPTAYCFSWKLCRITNGGAIASTGCTGFGLGDTSDPLSFSGELETYFFYKIGQDKVPTLGEAHSGSITKYLNENNLQEDYENHVYCISEYQLFGDPSLKIGGY